MDFVNIVVVGYPKSGTTWITRLTAELINCPVEGFWCKSDYNEIAMEGEARPSNYKCYKSHHQLSELRMLSAFPDKIIYVVRDPRDIVVSGMSYFKNSSSVFRNAKNPISSSINSLYRRTWLWKRRSKEQMIMAVLEGESNVHNWRKVSWKNHVEPYLDFDNKLIISYEQTLRHPEDVCKKILNYLGIQRNVEAIGTAINNQSFEVKKRKLNRGNNKIKAEFLRKGGTMYWKDLFSVKEKNIFNDDVGQMLKLFNYPLF